MFAKIIDTMRHLSKLTNFHPSPRSFNQHLYGICKLFPGPINKTNMSIVVHQSKYQCY